MTSAPSLSRQLWEENAALAQSSLAHPFVRGLAGGSLRRESFQYYVGQDAFFLESFARGYALGLARCPDGAGLRDFFNLLSGVLDELNLHAAYAQRWGLDLTQVAPGSATLAYTDFLLATAALGNVGDTCAAMTPCMRLYAFLGQSLAAKGPPPNNPYAEWIATYASSEFETLATTLERLLDRYALDSPAVRSMYRRAMALELAFFEASNANHPETHS